MNIKKYLEEKKDIISKNAKKAIATGLTVATILAGSSALTSCDRDNIEDLPDVDYSDLMSMIDEDINNFNEGFEYAGFMIGRNGNQYALIFLDEKFTDNASYNISKKQFDKIMESVQGLSIEDGVQFQGEDVVNISNEVLKLDGMDDVRKILADVVQKQDPFRTEMVISVPDFQDSKSLSIIEIERMIEELSKEHEEFGDFEVDEIIIKQDQEQSENGQVTLDIRDYYDSNNDGIDDRYKSFEVNDYINAEQLKGRLKISSDMGVITSSNGQYIITPEFLTGKSATCEIFDQYLSRSLSSAQINMDSLIDAPIENAPEMAD